MPRILFVFGTRPEAIKLAPVILALRREGPHQDGPGHHGRCEVRIAVTGQHRDMLDQVLEVFSIAPHHDLDVMRPGQSLLGSASRILSALEPVLADERPDWVVVQGDTTTAFCGAFAAFAMGIAVAHVEAGLRTGDPRQPFPEEMNRVLVSRLAAVHFTPTARAAQNLQREGVDAGAVHITGNTGIDAVLSVSARLASGDLPHDTSLPPLDPAKKLIVVTGHRRENFGAGLEQICGALADLAKRDDVEIVYPVHPNPNVSAPVRARLGSLANVHLIAPLSYVPFVDLMRRSSLLLTDSGGIQEEAPSLGKPVLVMREKTERPEAVEAGTARLVGAGRARIVAECSLLLDSPEEYARRSAIHNPFGDGHASERIADFFRRSHP